MSELFACLCFCLILGGGGNFGSFGNFGHLGNLASSGSNIAWLCVARIRLDLSLESVIIRLSVRNYRGYTNLQPNPVYNNRTMNSLLLLFS